MFTISFQLEFDKTGKAEHLTRSLFLLHLHLKLSCDVGNLFGRRFASSSALLRRVALEVDKSYLAVVSAGEVASFQVKIQR